MIEVAAVETMLLIRRAEETLLEMFSTGKLSGTVHTAIGQESSAVGILSAIDLERDIVVSNHRCHGHFLAYGAPPELLFAEVMGRHTGASRGIGGSQHLHWRNFYSNGVLGGMVAAGTGMALAERLKARGTVVVVFLGDGALGEGIVYESFNCAAIWKLPVAFVIEANGYAQSTPTHLTVSGSIPDRPRSFGIPTEVVDHADFAAVVAAAERAIARGRAGEGPACIVVETYRLGPHSKGDDTRSLDEIAARRAVDPLDRYLGELPLDVRASLQRRVNVALEAALLAADQAEPMASAEFRTLTLST